MKLLKNLLLATALCLVTVSFTQAQNKVAHINTQELISAMPESATAQKQLETLGKTYEADMQTMATELQNKVKQYDSEAATKTQEENGKRMQELQTMEQNVRQFQAQAQQDLAKKRQELMAPIQEKAMNAINKVAKAKGFQYVLDRSTLIVADGTDILADVKKELGI